jgi:hypothetical protein
VNTIDVTYNVIIVSHMRKKEQVDIQVISLPMKGGPGSWLKVVKNFKNGKNLNFFCFCGERGMCGRMPQLYYLYISW